MKAVMVSKASDGWIITKVSSRSVAGVRGRTAALVVIDHPPKTDNEKRFYQILTKTLISLRGLLLVGDVHSYLGR